MLRLWLLLVALLRCKCLRGDHLPPLALAARAHGSPHLAQGQPPQLERDLGAPELSGGELRLALQDLLAQQAQQSFVASLELRQALGELHQRRGRQRGVGRRGRGTQSAHRLLQQQLVQARATPRGPADYAGERRVRGREPCAAAGPEQDAAAREGRLREAGQREPAVHEDSEGALGESRHRAGDLAFRQFHGLVVLDLARFGALAQGVR
mmetsp:Transcript_81925/g.217096  ORF Transcript_81925/g.217096 Transcript_81925/m.217096 type:complete len:210 (-) Transcript_81925:114-743(-)